MTDLNEISAAKPSADLQSHVTVKQVAKAMNVSERSVYMAAKVCRLRPDLEAEVMAGRMSLNEAHRLATGRRKATTWDRLVAAWNNASDDDRGRLILQILRALP